MTRVYLGYGMGVDSTAILVRWLEDPSSRNFPLNDLTVVTAQTGNEFPDTGDMVTTHILPLLRKHHVRYVQLARSGLLQEAGVTLLDDSTSPTMCYVGGDYALAQEWLHGGTIQTSGLQRKCSQKFKGWVIDSWLDHELDEEGEAFRHAIGFNSEELRRVEKDQAYGSAEGRQPFYPLVDWDWDRQKCLDYIQVQLGVEWQKSCCVFCPFAGQGMERASMIERHKKFPAEAGSAALIELQALTLNPRMKLYKSRSLLSVLDTSANDGAVEAFKQQREAVPWALWHVRRIYTAPASARRSVQKRVTGTRKVAENALRRMAWEQGTQPETEQDGLLRLMMRRRAETYPTVEEMYVAGPALADNKQPKNFEQRWAETLGDRPVSDKNVLNSSAAKSDPVSTTGKASKDS